MATPTTLLLLRGSRRTGRGVIRRFLPTTTWSFKNKESTLPLMVLQSSALILALTTAHQQQQQDDDEKEKVWTRQRPHLLSLFPEELSYSVGPGHITHTQCEQQHQQQQPHIPFLMKTRATIRIEESSTRGQAMESKYDINWNTTPLGEGAFGTVHLATDKQTGQKVAVKKISKQYTTHDCFQREMDALLQIREAGGHPNICALREYFDFSKDYYTLILDYISGGEMFDHLVDNGAYSELDAARLIREVASAVAFLHGIDVVHADLKPENLMLSTERRADAVVKLVDFGCAKVLEPEQVVQDYDDTNGIVPDSPEHSASTATTTTTTSTTVVPRTKASQRVITPAYCPPECFQKNYNVEPPMDMWSLGIILYIMLTGRHPFDLNGDSSDKEVERRIKRPDTYKPPLRGSDVTKHLSDSAIELIEQLLERDPNKRLTAIKMLDHPWVRGETASADIIAGSDTRLGKFRKYKSKLQAKFFQNAVDWSDDVDDEALRKTSLIERYFQSFDRKKQGVVTGSDLGQNLRSSTSTVQGSTANGTSTSTTTILAQKDDDNTDESDDGPALSMSDFHNLLADSIQHRYFPKGCVIYREGEIGNAMYFINSGAIEVTTKDGTRATRRQGDFFGEGALLHPQKIRSATIRCKTPVHAIEIKREYFEKYVASSESGLLLTLREKDKIRKRNRAKTILRLHKNMTKVQFQEGELLFSPGDAGDALYMLDKGKVDINTKDKCVFSVMPGNVLGEYSLLTDQPRNVSAVCVSKDGCVAHKLSSVDFRSLSTVSPGMYEALSELRRRRDFKKAVVLRLKKEFPYSNPMEAFEAVDTKKRGYLDKDDIASLLRDMDPTITDEEILETIKSIDLSNSGTVTYDEFRKCFVADLRTSASM